MSSTYYSKFAKVQMLMEEILDKDGVLPSPQLLKEMSHLNQSLTMLQNHPAPPALSV
jgi:hypothetical protein